jgi:hypothetical protein
MCGVKSTFFWHLERERGPSVFSFAFLIQGDQNVSVHLMITIHYLAQSDCLVADCQGQGDTGLTLTPSVISNSNYVIMESD